MPGNGYPSVVVAYCCFSASLDGLQSIVNVCSKFALENDLVFNCKKSFGVMFLPRKFQRFGCPTLTLNHSKIRFVNSDKYLGVCLSSTLNDDEDIARKVRYMYCCANMLKYRFYRCSRIVKTIYFDLIVLRFTQVNYSASTLRMRYIGFVLLIMIVTVFCIIFLDGPVHVYLKLNAISIL